MSNVQDVEVAKWYTRARRFPQLIGKTPDGARLWGGPYTATQLLSGVAVLVLGLKTVDFWGAFGTVGNGILLLAVAYAVTLLLGRLPIGGRNPLSMGAGLLKAVSVPRSGKLAGRTFRLRRPYVARAKVIHTELAMPRPSRESVLSIALGETEPSHDWPHLLDEFTSLEPAPQLAPRHLGRSSRRARAEFTPGGTRRRGRGPDASVLPATATAPARRPLPTQTGVQQLLAASAAHRKETS
jgi:hypothetical protein